MPAGPLAPFVVTVTCTRAQTTEAGATVSIYRLIATACNRPAAGACPGTPGGSYVERQVTATVEN